jgi:hypothetical protein
MKKSILLVIVLAAAAQAQQPAPCLRLAKVDIPGHALGQQESTVARLTFKAHGCVVADLRDRTTVAFESSPRLDIAVNDIEFKDPDKTLASPGIQKARQLSLLLKLSASPDMAVGEHTLHGILTYQVIDSSGNPAPETLEIAFPLKVVPHKSHPESAFVHGLKTAGIIAARIPLIPLFILVELSCLITGNCTDC